MALIKNFVEEVLEHAPKKGVVVDLGAGEGEQIRQFKERGYQANAVDPQLPKEMAPGIHWIVEPVGVWLDALTKDEQFAIIFTRALLPFLEKDWVLRRLLPQLMDHLEPGGVLAIQTFTKIPDPPFNQAITCYSALELVSVLCTLEIPVQDQFRCRNATTDGIERDLQFTRVIARRLLR